MKLNANLESLRSRLAPIKHAAERVFSSQDGKTVLSALERAFDSDNLPRDSTGAIDPNAVLIERGARQVIDYLRTLAEPKKEGQDA
jgi:hypothetical protein